MNILISIAVLICASMSPVRGADRSSLLTSVKHNNTNSAAPQSKPQRWRIAKESPRNATLTNDDVGALFSGPNANGILQIANEGSYVQFNPMTLTVYPVSSPPSGFSYEGEMSFLREVIERHLNATLLQTTGVSSGLDFTRGRFDFVKLGEVTFVPTYTFSDNWTRGRALRRRRRRLRTALENSPGGDPGRSRGDSNEHHGESDGNGDTHSANKRRLSTTMSTYTSMTVRIDGGEAFYLYSCADDSAPTSQDLSALIASGIEETHGVGDEDVGEVLASRIRHAALSGNDGGLEMFLDVESVVVVDDGVELVQASMEMLSPSEPSVSTPTVTSTATTSTTTTATTPNGGGDGSFGLFHDTESVMVNEEDDVAAELVPASVVMPTSSPSVSTPTVPPSTTSNETSTAPPSTTASSSSTKTIPAASDDGDGNGSGDGSPTETTLPTSQSSPKDNVDTSNVSASPRSAMLAGTISTSMIVVAVLGAATEL